MKQIMLGAAVAFALLTAVFTGLFAKFGRGILQSLAITCGTFGYHLWVRLLIGMFYNLLLKNQVDYRRTWFTAKSWEAHLYDRLGVRRWKKKMPTFQPDSFDPHRHSWEEIARAMCQAELVHETNALASFLAVLGSVWFGAFWVFLLTSLAGAIFDLAFAVMQRYNRPRVLRLAEREKKSA